MQILTNQVQETLLKAASLKKDDIMMTRILGEDLVALEAKYHKNCYKTYTVIVSRSTKVSDEAKGDAYDDAFKKLLEQMEYSLITAGKAFEMSTLSNMYQTHLLENEVDELVSNYKL